MLAFGAGMLGTGGAVAPTAAPNPEDFLHWMCHTIRAEATPYPSLPTRALGSLGAYVWAKAFKQAEHDVVADLQGFYQQLATSNGATALMGATDTTGLFEAICRAEEPLIVLAMMLLDAGKVSCMHCADMLRSYSGMSTEALDGKATIFRGNVVNGHLPVLFTVEDTNRQTAAEEMLHLMQDAPVPCLTDLIAHFMAQGHMEGLMTEGIVRAPARTMNISRCLLVPTAWAPYFLLKPTVPDTTLAT
eukprot:14659433-Ditylum_brightwellii.AAC.1